MAAETIPPAPAHYFNDYAGVVSAATAAQLNQRLEQFERDSSCQIVVAVYPRMQSDSSIEDYTVRVAQSWKVGQKDKNNGAVLFVFIQDRKLFLQTGYGLEGALPDAICKRIIEDEIKPGFKAGNFDAGLTAGVNAILAAVKGEYKGTGQTAADRNIVVVGNGVDCQVVLRGRDLRGDFRPHCPVQRAARGILQPERLVGQQLGRWLELGGGGGFSSGGGGGGGFSGGGGSFGGGGAGGSW